MGVVDNTLEARVQALEAELAVMRGAASPRPRSVAAADVTEQREPSPEPVADRRGVVKLLAAGAVGAVAAGTLRGQPVAAADNDSLVLGTVNEAATITELRTSDDTALYVAGVNGYGVEAWGTFGNALFDANGDAPLGRAAWAGTLVVDVNGNWWAATKSDNVDGRWRKVAGPETAGALHLLPSPKRVYDSRPGEPPAIDPKAPLTPNVALSIDPKGNSSGVPAQAVGVLITVTVPALAAGGYATVWPSGPWPGTSNINFSPNQNIATTTVVGLGSDAKFLVQSNVSTNILIDVVGYYI